MKSEKLKTPMGKKVLQRCRELGMTFAQLERNINIGHGMISAYANGRVVPSKKTVMRIERELQLEECSLERLIERPEVDEEDVGHKPSAREQKILDAWKRGDRTPEEVAMITGYSMRIVGMYLMIEPKGT